MQLAQERDDLLPDFSKRTLEDRYILPGESYQQLFARVSKFYSDDDAHAQRMYDYHSKHWFMSATPVLSNGGTERGLPISCFLNEINDDMESIIDIWRECAYLGSAGGGLGTNVSNLRPIGAKVSNRGKSSGIIPFVKMFDSQVLAISQGSLRRGSQAFYLDVSHPEIEEFLEIRKPSGDFNRKSFNIHHGLVVTDKFMWAVRDNEDWDLIDPNSKKAVKTVSARDLWQRILETRIQTGEPYILFQDNANRGMPDWSRKLGMEITMSNLCIEIMQHTGVDYAGKERTAVCCLGSVNFDYLDEWRGNEQFLEDCWRYLDNVLDDFIRRTEGRPGFERARYSAMQQRSVGLGVMGFHSYLQSKGIPFESAMAKSINLTTFKWIAEVGEKVNEKLADEKGPCYDAAVAGVNRRFTHMMAIAPTASISIIAGSTSPCVEPWPGNVFTHKTLSGSFSIQNKHLRSALQKLEMDTEEVWDSITEAEGSVQHLDIPQDVKDVFKTAHEIDQRWLIELTADRTPYIDQSQSINLFIRANVDKWDLHMLHYTAWKLGVKSLYYLRSLGLQRASVVGGVEKDNTLNRTEVYAHGEKTDYEVCLACQ